MFQNCVGDDIRGRSLEWEGACRHLVEDSPECKQISSGVQVFGANLLRRHVGDGAQCRSRTSQMPRVHQGDLHSFRFRLSRLGGRIVTSADLRETEIENLGVSAIGDEDVRGLDVAVHNALGMRGVECVGDLDCESESGVERERLPGDGAIQSCAFEVLQCDVGAPFRFTDVIDGTNVGMIQSRCRLSLAPKSGKRLSIVGNLGQKLQSNETVKAGIFGLVDHAHAAPANFLRNLEGTHALTYVRSGRRGARSEIQNLWGREVEELAAGFFVSDDERFNFDTQGSILGAGGVEIGGAIFGGEAKGVFLDLLGPLPALGGHASGRREISRCSQARAAVQSRWTVAGPISRTWAVSSNESPAKKRSSTTRLWRGSSSARVLRASSRVNLQEPPPRFSARWRRA